MMVLFKSHNKGYTRKDGVYVAPFDDKRVKHTSVLPNGNKLTVFGKQPKKAAAPKNVSAHYGEYPSLFGGGYKHHKPKPQKPPAEYHPQPDDYGNAVGIWKPSTPTDVSVYDDPDAIATSVPDGKEPVSLGGIPFDYWDDAPTTHEGWAGVSGQNVDDEPPMPIAGAGKHVAAGVIIQEADGRVWVVHPTNKFGGYKGTFPKGTMDDDIPLQGSAIKETYEESGLHVELTGFLADIDRTTSVTRYYTGKRIGGTPVEAGWESQAVSLVPVSKLYDVLNRSPDHIIAEMLGAGKAPESKAKSFFDYKLSSVSKK